jgi:hypothetical protein
LPWEGVGKATIILLMVGKENVSGISRNLEK